MPAGRAVPMSAVRCGAAAGLRPAPGGAAARVGERDARGERESSVRRGSTARSRALRLGAGGARAGAALWSAADIRTANVRFFFPPVLHILSGFPPFSWVRGSGLVPVLPKLWLIAGFALRGGLPQCEGQRQRGLRSARGTATRGRAKSSPALLHGDSAVSAVVLSVPGPRQG